MVTKQLQTEISEKDNEFKFVISSEHIDRHGDKMLVEGIELTNYKLNPIILYNHNPNESIGFAKSLEIIDSKLIATAVITNESIATQIKDGSLRATSIGFVPKEIVSSGLSEVEKLQFPKLKSVNLITKSELYEFSIVTIPANPNAVRIKSLLQNIKNNVSEIMETKAGAVLSAQNKSKINKAIELLDSIQVLLSEMVEAEEKATEIELSLDELIELTKE